MATSSADSTRQAALDRLDRANANVRYLVGAVAVVEALLLVLVLVNIDFSDELHRLVFFLAMLTYATLGVGLMALGAHVGRVQAQLVVALETLREELANR